MTKFRVIYYGVSMGKIKPSGGDFNKSKGGINQYGAQGPNANPSDPSFDGYMQNTQGTTGGKKPSPMQMAQQVNQQNFGPPIAQGQGALAPENFGPPMVSKNGMQDMKSFGPPQAGQGENASKSGAHQNPTDSQAESPQGSSKSDSTSESNLDPSKPKPTYKGVEKMQRQAMMENAISEMHIKDPDPQAWN